MAAGVNLYQALNVLQFGLDTLKANPTKYFNQSPHGFA
jgi:hypothetical protein